MLIDGRTLERIRTGEVTLAFRRWKRPTVKPGGRLRTAVGELGIDAVDPIELSDISERDAAAAGTSLPVLLDALGRREGQTYRVRLHYERPDPRIALRAGADLDPAALEAVCESVRAMDHQGRSAPWTTACLALIRDNPGTRAADLAPALGLARLPFKARVRRLKELGLTVSLDVGYELSPLGRVVLEALSRGAPSPSGTLPKSS